MIAKRSVLIVDPLDENREVLRTALERRGMKIFEARRAKQGLDLSQRHQVDLVVLDLEVEESTRETIPADFQSATDANSPSIIVLGSARHRTPVPPAGEFVSKPYHYAPLVHKIEQLLASPNKRAA